MKWTVGFRDFEERDIEFVFNCKNNKTLNNLTVGKYKPFTYAEAEAWVKGCIGEHENFRFWAICTLDEKQDIIGWCSVADIDRDNSSASTHSIVIATPEYNDGLVWIETVLFMFEYVFEYLELNRLYGVSLVGHPMSDKIGDLMFMTKEGILRQAVFKNEKFYDLLYVAILRHEYFMHKENGDYEIKKIIRRFRQLRHG